MPVTQSRLGLARAAQRPAMHGRVMLSGPSGAGKTYTSLLVAEYLVGPEGRILVIDTEKESALTYADTFHFTHLPWNAPYDASQLAATLLEAGKEYDAVIVDSFSHFWRKRGGILDVAGGNFGGWKTARPLQESVIEAVLDADCHVIVCCRSKQEHVQEKDDHTGKTTIRKLGMKAQQDDDLEYEVNVSLEVDMAHVVTVAKSRTNAVPVGSTFVQGRAGDFAEAYRAWLAGGEPVAPKVDTDKLAADLNTIADQAERSKTKHMFLDFFGRPEFLLVSRLKEAQEWVADRVAGVAEPADRAEDEVPGEPDGSDQGENPPGGAGAPQEPAVAPQAETAPETATAQQAPSSDGAVEGAGEPAGQMGTADMIGPWLHSLTNSVLRRIAEDSGLTGITPSTTPGKLRDGLDGFYHMVLAGEATDLRACASCGGYTDHVPPFAKACVKGEGCVI